MEDTEFTTLVQEALLTMSVREIADGLHVSLPGVLRWSKGKNLPVNSIRPLVVSWLKKRIKK